MKHYICKCGAEAEAFVMAYPDRAEFGVDCTRCGYFVKCETRREADGAWLHEGGSILIE